MKLLRHVLRPLWDIGRARGLGHYSLSQYHTKFAFGGSSYCISGQVRSQSTSQSALLQTETKMAKKMLIGFDFDHTIIDDNSDIYVQRLAPDRKIPQEIKSMYSSECWTDYMQAIFVFLHQKQISKGQITDCMREIQLVEGMSELFAELAKDKYEVIIISDSNTHFIDTIVRHQDVKDIIHTVYSNPASFDSSGCLRIQYYHTQDWCDLSTRNLCKGHIFEEHIRRRKEQGVEFDQLAFVGDGANDLCPCLRMNKGDLAFARDGYSLVKKIDKYDGNGLLATVHKWETGYDILQCLQKHL